jgi:hypothetical protein
VSVARPTEGGCSEAAHDDASCGIARSRPLALLAHGSAHCHAAEEGAYSAGRAKQNRSLPFNYANRVLSLHLPVRRIRQPLSVNTKLVAVSAGFGLDLGSPSLRVTLYW